MIGHEVPPLAPVHFFRISADIKQGKKPSKKYLPNMTELLGEEHFADVGVSWQQDGLYVHLHALKKFEEASYPKYTDGDAFELYLDTRDMKEAGFPTRFCHHFLILPQEVQGVRILEITRFRTEDSHPLCDPGKIEISFHDGSRDYFLDLFFPAEVLHGYDPSSFDRLGLTYTVHRPKYMSQNFSVSSQYVTVAQNPSLWASCKLI